jgi:hypothetical protein
MEDRSLGRGRVSVPVVGLGTWRRLEAAAAAGRHRELMDTAIAVGIRLVDTSPMYGAAERLLAGALGGQRDRVVIADKVWTPSAEEGVAQLSRAVDWYGGRVDLMQIHNLVAWPAHLAMLAPLAGIQAPATGDLEPACLRSVCELLAHHTPAPARCWFAVWEGWGDLRGSGQVASSGLGALSPPVRPVPATWQLNPHAPMFALPHRVYYLFTRPLDDAVKIGRWVTCDWFVPRSPNLFWPHDRSWCVASEIDFDSTTVGGKTDLIAEVLRRDDLEAWPVVPDDSLAWDGDAINEP